MCTCRKQMLKRPQAFLESACKPSRWWSSTSATSSVMKSWTVRCMCCRLSTEQPDNIRALHVKRTLICLKLQLRYLGYCSSKHLILFLGRRFDSFKTFDMLGMFWIEGRNKNVFRRCQWPMLWQRDVCWKSTGWQWGPQLRWISIPTKCSKESLKLFDSGIGLQSVDEIPTRYIDIDTIYKYSHDVDILWIILFCIPYKFVFLVSVLFRNCSFCFLGFHVYFFIVIKSIFEISLISILGATRRSSGSRIDWM